MLIDTEGIIVENRRRVDLGDIPALADSIRRVGLIHAIVITDDLRLVAGERRLRAVQSLGWPQIEARLMTDLTNAELREIELEENLHRKDLTAIERSRFVVALAETAAEVLRETPFKLNEVSGTRGPAPKLDSQSRVADRLGVAQSEISKAAAHVAAVEAHPQLATEPQSVALDYARAVKEQPDLAEADAAPRDVVDIARQRREAAREQAREEQAMADHILDVAGDPDGRIAHARVLAAVSGGIVGARKLLTMDPTVVVPELDEAGVRALRWLIRDARAWFDHAEALLTPRLRVVGDK